MKEDKAEHSLNEKLDNMAKKLDRTTLIVVIGYLVAFFKEHIMTLIQTCHY